MKIRQPFVLLLGGLLSASSIGCSAVSAIVSNSHAAPRDGRGGATDRLVAIGRVFENQGRYDHAEVMYRRALKDSPKDATIQRQLQQLADRREGRQFKPDPVASAIALADSVNATNRQTRRRSSAEPSPATANNTQEPAATEAVVVAVAATDADSPRVELAAVSVDSTTTAGESRTTPDPKPTIESTTAPESTAATEFTTAPESTDATEFTTVAESDATPTLPMVERSAPESDLITADQILAVIDDSAGNASLLLRGLQSGDSLETQCLAATLLGDCDPSDEEVGDTLDLASRTASDDRLRLAIAASRIQRDEADSSTADCLIALLNCDDEELQIQAAAEVRHFVGKEPHDRCVSTLRSLLTNESERVRAIAAVTLGDFQTVDAETISQLRQVANDDQSPEVRDAASAAIGRTERNDLDNAQAMIVAPR